MCRLCGAAPVYAGRLPAVAGCWPTTCQVNNKRLTYRQMYCSPAGRLPVCPAPLGSGRMRTGTTPRLVPQTAGQAFSGIRLTWYGLLVAPFMAYPAILLMASCFVNRGPVTLAGICILIGFRLFHSHRINHISRLIYVELSIVLENLLRCFDRDRCESTQICTVFTSISACW